ncbi:integrase, catalytic region, zinc finger, CCHC-type containing protein [Tanacetum coccineum]
MGREKCFLNGTLKDDVYVCQPEGFIDADNPSHIYKLKKALYGLNQAPKAWYNELSKFLLQNHFFKGTIDPTLFIRCFDDDILVVQVYVDDIIFGSTNPRTPMEIKDKFDLDQNGTLVDATKYRSMISVIMYLTSSRPDIVHATCLCARYQAKRTEKHLKEDSGFELTGFSDADYAGCKDTFKSTSGGAQFLGKKLTSPPMLERAEIEALNLILISIPNYIYNSVDACTTAKAMWQRVERLMRGTVQNKVDRENIVIMMLTEDSYDDLFDYLQQFEKPVNASRAKKLEKSHDPLVLVAHTGSSSRTSSPYYVTHPSFMVDYDDDYQGDTVQNNSDDPLTFAMILLAHAITRNFSNPTNNRLRTSSNTRIQAIVQGDRVNIQSKNSDNDGRNTRHSYVQEEVIESNNVQNDAGNIQRTLRTASSRTIANDEAGVILTDEQNDFLFADASRMEEIEELSVNICLMARIQPANIDFYAGPSYDSAFLRLSATSSVRRPSNRDSSLKNSVVSNTKNSSKKVEVFDRTNKKPDVASKNVALNKIVTNDEIQNALIEKNILCVSCAKNVLILCHDNCLAKYKLNVRRALFTTPRTVKSTFKDTTPVVSKTRFSVRTVQSKSLDTTPVVSKAKIVTDTPLSAKNKVVQIVLWIVDSGCSKHMTGDRSLLKNFVEKFMGTVRFGNDHFAAITGYGDYVQGNIMIFAFRSKTCYVRNLEGDDLLTGDRESNLYTISIPDMAASSPVCLMSKASSTKSWLWHRRLSHLNFGTINDLTKHDLVDGLPKFKYGKDHLCSACERGKSKKASHPPKLVPSSHSKLELLHMDLYGPMRVASINGKRYILVIVDDYS